MLKEDAAEELSRKCLFEQKTHTDPWRVQKLISYTNYRGKIKTVD